MVAPRTGEGLCSLEQIATRRTEARYPSGKGEVCKTFMRRFDSDPRLQNLIALRNCKATLALQLGALAFHGRYLAVTYIELRLLGGMPEKPSNFSIRDQVFNLIDCRTGARTFMI